MTFQKKQIGSVMKLITVITIFTILAILVLLLTRPSNPVALITKGMRYDDVVNLLGDPPGDVQAKNTTVIPDQYSGGVLMKEGSIVEWWRHDGLVQVAFSDASLVVWVRFVDTRQSQTWIQRLKTWLYR